MPIGHAIIVSAESDAIVARSAPAVPPSESGPAPAGTADTLTLERLGDLIDEEAAAAGVSDLKMPGVLKARDSVHRRLERVSRFPLALVLGWRKQSLRRKCEFLESDLHALVARRNQARVDIRFRFGQQVRAACETLVSAHKLVGRCSKLWAVTADAIGQPGTILHGRSLPKAAASAYFVMPEQIAADWPALALRSAATVGVDIFPGFIIVRADMQPGRSRVVSLLDARIETRDLMVAEPEAPPSDATVSTYTWVRTTKDGGPDRRYSNNPRIPVVRYGLIHLEVPGVVQIHLVTSVADASAAFARAFTSVQEALRAEMTTTRDDHVADRDWLAVGGTPIDGPPRLEVPPFPSAGAAHEYTAAGLMALVVGFGVLGGEPRPRPTSHPPDASTTVRAAIPASAGTSVGDVLSSIPSQPEPDAGKASVETDPRKLPPTSALSPSAVLSPPPAPPAPVPVQKRERVVVRNGGYVRAGPNNTSAVVRTAAAGARMNVFAKSNGWVQVGETEPSGWIWSGLVEPAE